MDIHQLVRFGFAHKDDDADVTNRFSLKSKPLSESNLTDQAVCLAKYCGVKNAVWKTAMSLRGVQAAPGANREYFSDAAPVRKQVQRLLLFGLQSTVSDKKLPSGWEGSGITIASATPSTAADTGTPMPTTPNNSAVPNVGVESLPFKLWSDLKRAKVSLERSKAAAATARTSLTALQGITGMEAMLVTLAASIAVLDTQTEDAKSLVASASQALDQATDAAAAAPASAAGNSTAPGTADLAAALQLVAAAGITVPNPGTQGADPMLVQLVNDDDSELSSDGDDMSGIVQGTPRQPTQSRATRQAALWKRLDTARANGDVALVDRLVARIAKQAAPTRVTFDAQLETALSAGNAGQVQHLLSVGDTQAPGGNGAGKGFFGSKASRRKTHRRKKHRHDGSSASDSSSGSEIEEHAREQARKGEFRKMQREGMIDSAGQISLSDFNADFSAALPRNLDKDIARGKFNINFLDLLIESAGKQRSSSKRTLDRWGWLAAFKRFSHSMVQHFPSSGPALTKYGLLIDKLYTDFRVSRPEGAALYDTMYRQRAAQAFATTGGLADFKLAQDIYNTVFHGSRAAACNICGSDSHIPSTCPSVHGTEGGGAAPRGGGRIGGGAAAAGGNGRQGGGQGVTWNLPPPPGTCNRFNTTGCRLPLIGPTRCKYTHRCSKCSREGHGASTCTQ